MHINQLFFGHFGVDPDRHAARGDPRSYIRYKISHLAASKTFLRDQKRRLQHRTIEIGTHAYITIASCGDQPLPPAALSKT